MKKIIFRILAIAFFLIVIVVLNKFGLGHKYIYSHVIEFGLKHGISTADIINSAIGAFFGMITSLMLEKFLESNNKKKSIDNIIAELESIRNGLNEQIISKLPAENCQEITNGIQQSIEIDADLLEQINGNIKDLAYVIYVPIWETVLQTGDILEFKEKKYFEELIRLYTKIYKLKALIDDHYNEKEVNVVSIKKIIIECLELNVMFTNREFYISKLFR